MARRNHTPTYRLHKSSGLGVVTLTDAVTGRRKDVLLGPHDTQASRDEYAQVLSEWVARGRRLDATDHIDLTVAELLGYRPHSHTSWRETLDPRTLRLSGKGWSIITDGVERW